VLRVLAERDPVAIMSGALDDHVHDVEFFEKNEFSVVLREPSSELDVTTFDEKRFSKTLERICSEGIEIVSLRDLQRRNTGWEHQVHRLYELIRKDMPSAEPYVERPFSEFKRSHLSGPTFDSDGWFVALDGEKYVGMSMAWRNQVESDRADSGLTGVIRAYRRRGIATALKVHVIGHIRRMGMKTIVTFNEEGNPMYELNLSLGFVAKPAWVVYKKLLKEGGEGR
jgi:GNAT superfamily N-acetyltransferase